jgi:hypothetical protein
MMRDDEVVPTGSQLDWQERYCRAAGSPTSAEILRAVIDDLDGPRNLAPVLPTHTRFGDLIGLRIMAAVHLLAIERQAPAVAIFAPTLGGVAPSLSANPDRAISEFHAAVVDAITVNAEMMAKAITEVPQTNEVGRSRLLRIALSMIRGDVRLFEFGASAGLNLRADRLPGDPALESGPMPRVIERRGCDLNPIDPTTTPGRARLTSYVWMDDIDRFERLRGALRVAAEIPASVVTQDAADFVDALELGAGSTTVLWHSSMWGYLPESTRVRIDHGIERLGSAATSDNPLWHVAWEPMAGDRDRHELTVQVWNGNPGSGVARTLATGTTHGGQITLTGGDGDRGGRQACE